MKEKIKPQLTEWQMQERMAYPYDVKVQIALDRIREFHDHFDGNVFVSYSGGKDSSALLHLARTIYPEMKGVFCNTGLEYPELVAHVKQTPNVEIIRPKMSFADVIEKFGWPVVSKEIALYLEDACRPNHDTDTWRRRALGINPDGTKTRYCVSQKWRFLIDEMNDGNVKISMRCCRAMKERPFNEYTARTGQYAILGMMASESRTRMAVWKKYGCNAYGKKIPQSRPMMAWNEQDIYRYLVENNISIPSVYGDIVMENGIYRVTGLDRTGCMFCMFGVHMDESPNRFERMRETHPKQWDYVINRLGGGKVLDLIKVKY